MPGETAQFMLIVAGITMVVTPLVAQLARRLARVVESRDARRGAPDADLPTDLADHVIIVGYGRVGQLLGSILDGQRLVHVALDIDMAIVARYRAEGGSIFYGDASRYEMLEKLNAGDAAALVITMDSPHAAERVVATAHKHWPGLAIYARAHDVDHAARLIDQGATHAVPEATEASLQLSEQVLMGAGVPEPAARQMIESRRQAEQVAIDEGDLPRPD